MALAVVCYLLLLNPESPGASVNCLVCNFSTSPSVVNKNFRTCVGQRKCSPLESVNEVVSIDETLIRRSQVKNMEGSCAAHRSLDILKGINLEKSTCDESHLSPSCDHQNTWKDQNKMLKLKSLENNLTTFAKRDHQEFLEALSIFQHNLKTERRRNPLLVLLSLIVSGDSASARFNVQSLSSGFQNDVSFLKWMMTPVFDCYIPLLKSHPFGEASPDFLLTVKNKSNRFPGKEIPVSSKQIKISGSLASSLQHAIFSTVAFGIAGASQSRGKLAFRMKLFVGFMIFSAIFREADCFQSSSGLAANLSSSTFEKRINSALDLRTLLISLSDQQMQLQLLYNQQNEEMINNISRLLALDFCSLKLFLYNSNSSATVSEIINSARYTTLLALLPPKNFINIFHEIKRNRLESHLTKWVFILDEKMEEMYTVVDALKTLVFEGTQVHIAVWKPAGSFAFFSSRADDIGRMQFYYRGKLTISGDRNTEFLHKLMESEEFYIGTDMHHRELTVAAKSILPYFGIIDYNPDGSIKSASGIDYSILKSLSSFLNFTYRIIGPPDGAFGYPQPDGTITGMIGMAARREIHLAVTGIGANDKRDTVVDFTVPYTQGSLGIYSRAPKLKSSTMAVLSPFTPEVWLCLIFALLAMGPLLWAQSLFLGKLHEDSKLTLQTFSFNVFRSLINQGNSLTSYWWPQRFMFFSWYLFSLITSALYSGTLTAVLAVPAYEKPVDSLLDLPRAVEEGFTLTVTKDSTHEYLFKEAKEGIYKRVWELFNHKDRSKSFVSSPAVGLNLVLEKKVIHICLEDVAKVVGAGLGRNKFHFSRELFFPQNVVFVVPPGAPYKESFNRVMQKLIEGGFIDKWEYDEIKKISQKSSGGGRESRSQVISLGHLQAAFFVILSGYVIAAMVLLMEKFFSRLME